MVNELITVGGVIIAFISGISLAVMVMKRKNANDMIMREKEFSAYLSNLRVNLQHEKETNEFTAQHIYKKRLDALMDYLGLAFTFKEAEPAKIVIQELRKEQADAGAGKKTENFIKGCSFTPKVKDMIDKANIKVDQRGKS